MENVKIDFDPGKGAQIGDQLQSNIDEERMLTIIEKLKPEFLKDGNKFCYLYGDLATGIAGFGDTAYNAMSDFCKNFYNQKA